jgi:hypothetical protein
VSIYATTFSIEEDHEPGVCAKWVECDKDDPDAAAFGWDDRAWRRSSVECTCGNLGPWLYRGSHVLPAKSDPRGGDVSLAYIPDHITRDGRDDGKEGPKDWMRLSVYEPAHAMDGYPDKEMQDATVVLNRSQVEALRDALTEWLERKPE